MSVQMSAAGIRRSVRRARDPFDDGLGLEASVAEAIHRLACLTPKVAPALAVFGRFP